MRKCLHAKRLQGGVIAGDNFTATLQHARIAVQLAEADGRRDVRHVAFVPWADDVVLPCAELRLREGVLRLAMEGEELRLLVDDVIIDAGKAFPCHRAAFGGGQILDGVEGKRREIGN